MGLDMYVHKTRVAPKKKCNFRDNLWEDDDGNELMQPRYDTEVLFMWVKHPDLHWWFTELYEDNGGECDIDLGNGFNLKSVELDIDDLEELRVAVVEDKLPKNDGRGFFFGESEYPYHHDQTRLFIVEAKQAIADGWYLYYRAFY